MSLSTMRIYCAAVCVISLLVGCGGGGGSSDGAGGSSGSTSSSAGSTAPLGVVSEVSGFASQGTGTTGGVSAPASNVYVVHNWAELNNALLNARSPTYATDPAAAKLEPKIIYVVGTIWGTDLGNGKFADEAYYKSLNTTAAKWDWSLYLLSQDTAYMADLNAKATAGDADAIAQKAKISALSSARTTLSNLQKAQIQFIVPSNTTVMGVGADAKIIDGYFSINAVSNIIIRNLEFQAPIDITPSYTATVGKEEWNSRFKALSMVTGKQIWIDHCTFSDGAHPDGETLTINGVTKEVQRHDGLLDIEDSSDYVTISYSVFKNHDKTNMVGGSGDGNGSKERAYNHLTFSNNIWQDSVQRAPRVRFGQVHVYNNYYKGDTDTTPYGMSYFIGMGAESRILSEANAFELSGSSATVSRVISNLNGYQFKDVGSWFNGSPASDQLEAAAKAALEARYASAVSAGASSGFTVAPYTNELGWSPSYAYTRGASAADVKAHDLANAGAGKLPFAASAATRLQISDTLATDTYAMDKLLAGSDAWAPQSVNAGKPNAGRVDTSSITPDYIVAKDGSGTYATIQEALNAASLSGAARVYIQVKAGTYNELLIAGASATTAITLYSKESDASKVVVNNALYQNSTGAEYNALVTAATYAGNADATTAYTACSKKTTSIGKECSTTLRVRNNGFTAVNMTFQNSWNDSNASGSDQALAAQVEKVDQVVFDGTRLISNQDTLYLQNSGKRSYFVAGEIVGDVDVIFGPGAAAFDGTRITYTGVRKASGSAIAAPSTLKTQLYGFLFNRCVFVADAAAAADGTYVARQWDDDVNAIGKVIVRNSVLAKHINLSSGPWSPTPINKSRATLYEAAGEPYLAEYHNWTEASAAASSSSSVASSASSSSSSSSSSLASSSSSSSVASSSSSSSSVSTGATDVPITGSTLLTNAYASSGLPGTVATTYDSVSNAYAMVSAGSIGTSAVLSDTLQYAYARLTGDFTLIARLTSLEIPTGLSTANVRAGLMLRNSLADNSRFFGILVRGVPRVQWEQRLADGGTESSANLANLSAQPSASAPVWLKLQRVGQVISVSYSVNAGVTWLPSPVKTQDFASATGAVALDSTVYVGLAGVSGSATVTSQSSFDNVSLTLP